MKERGQLEIVLSDLSFPNKIQDITFKFRLKNKFSNKINKYLTSLPSPKKKKTLKQEKLQNVRVCLKKDQLKGMSNYSCNISKVIYNFKILHRI